MCHGQVMNIPVYADTSFLLTYVTRTFGVKATSEGVEWFTDPLKARQRQDHLNAARNALTGAPLYSNVRIETVTR